MSLCVPARAIDVVLDVSSLRWAVRCAGPGRVCECVLMRPSGYDDPGGSASDGADHRFDVVDLVFGVNVRRFYAAKIVCLG